MKTFKQFNNNQMNNPFLDWKSSFGEIRNRDISESEEILGHMDRNSSLKYMDPIHNHPDIDSNIPKESNEHIYVHDYCSTPSDDVYAGHASSGNMNAYLRNRMGNISSQIRGDHDPDTVKESIKNLSSVFTPERTNRKSIRTYTGIPYRIHNLLSQLKSGDTTHIPGFTSTSTDKRVAKRFSMSYNHEMNEKPYPRNTEYGIINFHVNPGSGLSVPKHSSYPHENEILLHHGAKVTYLGNEESRDSHGDSYMEHHMMVHPEHLPLEKYLHKYVYIS